jgi:hypothetical protein
MGIAGVEPRQLSIEVSPLPTEKTPPPNIKRENKGFPTTNR